MSIATYCPPVVIPTRAPLHRRLAAALRAAASQAWIAARQASDRSACQAALRRLSPQTLRDIGLAHCVHEQPTLPRVGWEYGRWI